MAAMIVGRAWILELSFPHCRARLSSFIAHAGCSRVGLGHTIGTAIVDARGRERRSKIREVVMMSAMLGNKL